MRTVVSEGHGRPVLRMRMTWFSLNVTGDGANTGTYDANHTLPCLARFTISWLVIAGHG